MKSLFVYLVLYISVCAFSAQAQSNAWELINPQVSCDQLTSIHVLDGQTAWIVGASGTILHTTNGGEEWVKQLSGTKKSLLCVYFLDAQHGWAAGDSGTILVTADGGGNWVSKYLEYLPITQIKFFDLMNGRINRSDGRMMRTTNGGEVWFNQDFTFPVSSFSFLDEQVGWAASSNNKIYRTTNAAQSWTQHSTCVGYGGVSSLQMVDSLTGYAIGPYYGYLTKTLNGGQSWFCPSSVQGLRRIFFSNALVGWCFGQSGPISKTTDGGASWNQQSSVVDAYLSDIKFANPLEGWAVGNGGTIVHTTDGGNTWIPQKTIITPHLMNVQFISSKTGWVGGMKNTLFKTTNGGLSWTKQFSPGQNSISSISFSDSLSGWLVGSAGCVRKTINGGALWTVQNLGINVDLNSVQFFGKQNGWIVGGNKIYHTSNGGVTWQNQSTLSDQINLNHVHFVDSLTGFAVGSPGVILKTTNGGDDWTSQTIPTIQKFSAVQFIDNQLGWVVGQGGRILRTTDGGQSWSSSQVPGPLVTLSSLSFENGLTGYVSGPGYLYKTSDGGETWALEIHVPVSGFNSIQFVRSNSLWVVGSSGLIFKKQISTTFPNENPISTIRGKVFHTTPGNCQPTNPGLPYHVVKALPGPYYGLSNSNGQYELPVPQADSVRNFSIRPISSSGGYQQTTVCPPSGQIALSLAANSEFANGNHFGISMTPCHRLEVNLSSLRRRPCFASFTNITYWNQGALAAPNAYIQVEFPQWVRPLSTSSSYVAVNDSVWKINLGNVPPGGQGRILIKDSMFCGVNPDLLAICTKATIYPAPDCIPQNNWSGAEVSVSGVCENGLVKLGIYNRSTADMPDSVDYSAYLDSIQVKSAKVKLLAGDSLKLNVLANGMGVYLSVNQVANHPGQAFVSTVVEGCGMLAASPVVPVSTHWPVSQLPNSKTQCLPIVNSHDPNDKQVFPIGFTPQGIIAPDTRLEYLIRFQNTGTDTAFNVFVLDTLDSSLDIESFQMGSSSHSYSVSFIPGQDGKTALRWQFSRILLPDSNTNELASNGYIQFWISPKAGLPLGTQVHNRAGIYFDFNPPIITNQTLTTFDVVTYLDSTLNSSVQVVTAVDKQLELDLGVKLYPNPVTQNQLTVSFAEPGLITLQDALGRLVYRKKIEGTEVLPVSLQAGFYFASVETRKGRKTVKVIVE